MVVNSVPAIVQCVSLFSKRPNPILSQCNPVHCLIRYFIYDKMPEVISSLQVSHQNCVGPMHFLCPR
jgi:hypothetical protein